MTTDYTSLSDADLNAAIAVRVCGWPIIDENEPYRWYHYDHKGVVVVQDKATPYEKGAAPERFPRPECIPVPFRPATVLDDAFLAQSALAAKGEEYMMWYKKHLVDAFYSKPAFPLQSSGGFIDTLMLYLMTADVRTRCVAMLQACDAVEKS